MPSKTEMIIKDAWINRAQDDNINHFKIFFEFQEEQFGMVEFRSGCSLDLLISDLSGLQEIARSESGIDSHIGEKQ